MHNNSKYHKFIQKKENNSIRNSYYILRYIIFFIEIIHFLDFLFRNLKKTCSQPPSFTYIYFFMNL